MISSAVIAFSCSGNSEKLYEEIHLTHSDEIYQLSDSSYISSIVSMKYYGDKLYLSENKRCEILVLDDNLNYINSIGRMGRGPDELMDINRFIIYGDTILIKDPGNNRVQKYFLTGEYIKSIPLSKINIDIINGFNLLNGHFIGSSKGDSAIVSFKLVSDYLELYKEFGCRYKFNEKVKEEVCNGRYLMVNKGKLIAVSDNLPYIEVYDSDYNLINIYDISESPIIEKQIKYINTEKLSGKSYRVLIQECDIYDNHLYILVNQFTDGYSCNTILMYSLNDMSTPKKILYLPNVAYSSFTIGGDNIYAFSHDGVIQKFDLQ